MDSPAESYDPQKKRCLKQPSVEAPVSVTQGHTFTGNAPRYHWYLNKSLRLSLDHLLSIRRSCLTSVYELPADAGDTAARLLTPRIDIRGTRPAPINWAQSIRARPLHHTTSTKPRFHVEQGSKEKTRHLGNSPKHRVSWGSKGWPRRRQNADRSISPSAFTYSPAAARRFQPTEKTFWQFAQIHAQPPHPPF
jgi:hypothetical protein